jgi:hypothetical protein
MIPDDGIISFNLAAKRRAAFTVDKVSEASYDCSR